MQLMLERRPQHSRAHGGAVAGPGDRARRSSPSSSSSRSCGIDPLKALYLYFIDPLTAGWSIEDLLVKAAPIILIAIGLSFCYQSNVWNIGAEGQFAVGAICGSIMPVYFPDWQGPVVIVPMLLIGILGGMAYAAIPAWLKNRFNANETLTTLMLVYVANLMLDYLARGPWRDPAGHNFPNSRPFDRRADAAGDLRRQHPAQRRVRAGRGGRRVVPDRAHASPASRSACSASRRAPAPSAASTASAWCS